MCRFAKMEALSWICCGKPQATMRGEGSRCGAMLLGSYFTGGLRRQWEAMSCRAAAWHVETSHHMRVVTGENERRGVDVGRPIAGPRLAPNLRV
jgi:hypothetical protein